MFGIKVCTRVATGCESLTSTVRMIHLDELLHVLYVYAMNDFRAAAMLCYARAEAVKEDDQRAKGQHWRQIDMTGCDLTKLSFPTSLDS